MKTQSLSLFAGLKKHLLSLAVCLLAATGAPAQTPSTNAVLILYDSGTNTANASVGWIGNLHAKFLANLLGHFDLNYTIEPVENYQAGQMTNASAIFYLGLIYDNPLPAAFTNDVTTTTNPVCWIKYNMWQVSGNVYFPQPLDSRIGFRFLSLDESGYTNVIYRGISLQKNPLDPELGVAGIINSNIASSPAVAWRTNADNSTANIPYITHGSNFWYVGDSPFDYMGEQDRYLAFCDVLHDILGINMPESHTAIIRLEDVTMDVYATNDLTPCVDYLHTNNVPFAIAVIPYYTDPLGYYNSGIPESHRISDGTDPLSVDMLHALEHATNSGGQILIHGYTHQYDSTENPYTGVSADDFEFWRETLTNSYTTNGAVITTNFVTGIYQPVAEDSAAWAYGRISAATNEFTQAGLRWVGWETVHYTASATDYRVFATNFNLTMQRVIYFADDYDAITNPTHLSGQLFPYVIDKDVYGQKIVPESCGNFESSEFENYAQHSVADIVNAAHAALAVRDGWANAFYHGFYGVTNLQAIVTGIQALGYTYVPLVPSGKPAITFQPRSQTNQPAGTNFLISVAVIGSQPLSYQWWFNGTNQVPGATNALLYFPGAQPTNSGNYTAIITNAFGAVTSLVAVVDVGLPPAITNPPAAQTNLIGNNVTFAAGVGGSTPLAYQWVFNDTNSLPGATNASLVLTNVQVAGAGNYSIFVTNRYGSATSTDALLTLHLPPIITNQPASQYAILTSNVVFTVGAIGDTPLAYQWYFNVTNKILNATNPSFSLASAKVANNGGFTVVITNLYGVTTSAVAVLTVVSAPVITNQPAGQTVTAGASATFAVGAVGSVPLSYQWWFNATNSLGGATNAVLTVTNVQAGNIGNYTVIVGNSFGSVTSSIAALNFHSPPAITNPPASLAIVVSNNAAFTVGAAGDQPLAYQWWFNATNSLGGATNATLTISNAPLTAAGGYTVIITNAYGAVTSTIATLTIYSTPVITNPPAAQSVILSNTATFTVGATGSQPLAYQWWFNGSNLLAGATAPALAITNAQPASAGNYTVVVTNSYGAVTSAPALLTVHIPPFITNAPAGLSVVLSNNATFTVGAGGDQPLAYQWWFNATNQLGGATNATLTVSNAPLTAAGGYTVVITNNYGAVTSSVATLTIQTAPVITNPPAGQAVLVTSNVTFTVGVTGSQPLSYQWWFNATNSLGGATNSTLTLTNVQAANAGGYTVVITNTYGAVTSSIAALVVHFPPFITNAPAGQAVILSNSATFTVGAGGDQPLAYQWWFNATNPVSGATGSSLVISNAQPGNAGAYSVVVTNSYGAVTSAPAALTVGIPPFITNPPAAQSVILGSNATFIVGAGGDQPLVYQWWFNATNLLAGATNSTFVLTNAQAANAGGYTVIITNNSGSVTSSVAGLTVGNPVVITNDVASQSVVLSNNVTFTVGVSGDAPLSYQWWFNGTNLIPGATGPALGLTNAQPANAGGYSVVVGNPYNSVTSSVAVLTVNIPPFITNQPASLAVGLNSNATFSVGAGGDQPLSYQWFLNATNAIATGTNSLLTVTNAQGTDLGAYTVIVTNNYGAVTSSVATLALGVPPVITNDLTGQSVILGSNATFTVGAAGDAPLSYQWWFNSTNPVAGATGGSLVISNAEPGNAGGYSVVVSNPFGMVTSLVANLTVAIPPFITNQPAGLAAILGNNATFTVGAGGDAPLGYQWFFNATNSLMNATNTSLILTNVAATNAGGYTVVVTNNSGSVTSAVAVLTVGVPPGITTQPTNLTVLSTSNATFTVIATGTPTLYYNWQHNGTNLPGATGAILVITNAHSVNSGNYDVVVTNGYGSVTSAVAGLTVGVPPGITTQPTNRTVTAGASTTFTVVAGGSTPLYYQWRFNATNNILNATNATFTLTNVVATNAGNFTVVVTNNYGSVTSSAAALTVNGPPFITVQPTNHYVVTGANVTFSLVVLGTTPLNYQWRFNGRNINGASGRGTTYAVNNAQSGNVGNYDVVINNTYGSVTSAVAVLSIGLAPAITNQPTNRTVAAGGSTTFTVGASGTAPLAYQWRYNATNNILNATNATFSLTGLVATNAGNYTVVVTNNYGSVTSSVAALTINGPPFITTQPTNLTVLAGSNAAFTVVAAGSAPLSYQWWFNTTNSLLNATNTTLALTNVVATNAGNYTVVVTNSFGSATSAVAVLTVTVPTVAPFITNQPAGQTVILSNSATFIVGAGGDQPLAYQWWFNATNLLAGVTNSAFTLTNVQPANAGGYSVVVTNNSGSVTSAVAVLTVTVPGVAPFITNPPASQSVVLSNSVTFTVGAGGDAPLSYQWWFNGTSPVGGAVGPAFTLTNAQAANAGGYSVVVSNPSGVVTSLVATLTVNIPPFITNPPAGQVVASGNNAAFTVGAGGDQPLVYQWWFNATNLLAGVTNSTLVITNAQSTNAGGYTVIVTNNYGAVTSGVAVLTIGVPPFITNQPASLVILVTSNATFAVGAGGDAPLGYQWWFNATNLLTGSTNPVLTIYNAPTNSAGSYAVVVTNNYGSVTSAVAVLTVNVPVVTVTNAPVITAGGSPVQLTFPTQPGFNYYIEYEDTLTAGAWQQLTNVPGSGSPVNVPVSLPASTRFYRVRVQ